MLVLLDEPVARSPNPLQPCRDEKNPPSSTWKRLGVKSITIGSAQLSPSLSLSTCTVPFYKLLCYLPWLSFDYHLTHNCSLYMWLWFAMGPNRLLILKHNNDQVRSVSLMCICEGDRLNITCLTGHWLPLRQVSPYGLPNCGPGEESTWLI